MLSHLLGPCSKFIVIMLALCSNIAIILLSSCSKFTIILSGFTLGGMLGLCCNILLTYFSESMCLSPPNVVVAILACVYIGLILLAYSCHVHVYVGSMLPS